MWSSCDRPRNNDQESPHISFMEWTICWLDFWSRKWAASHEIISDRIPIGHTFNLVNWFCRERDRHDQFILPWTWVTTSESLSLSLSLSISASLDAGHCSAIIYNLSLTHVTSFWCWPFLVHCFDFGHMMIADRWSLIRRTATNGRRDWWIAQTCNSPPSRRVVVLGPTADLYNQYFNKKRISRLEGGGPDRE